MPAFLVPLLVRVVEAAAIAVVSRFIDRGLDEVLDD